MQTEKQKIIDIFCQKFLTIQKMPENFTEILDSSPSILKDCSEEFVKKLKAKKYSKIRDLAKIDQKKIQKVAEKIEIDEFKLRKWVMASQLVVRAWENKDSYLKKKEFKICVLGLDNAGKTSMLQNLSGKANLGDYIDLEPTIGIDVRKIDSNNFNMLIWDFGGQVEHRNDYFQAPEQYFVNVDLVIFVIDMQDSSRFDESVDYFEKIIDVLSFLSENPYYLILLHKADPDLRDDPDFKLKIDLVTEIITKNLEEKKSNFEIILSSIYNFYATEPDFAKTFKRFFADKSNQKTIEEQVVNLTELVLNLTTTIKSQYDQIMQLMAEIKTPKNELSSTTQKLTNVTKPPMAPSALVAPPPPPPPSPNAMKSISTSTNPASNRADLLNELKSIFAMRRMSSQ